VPDQKLTDFLTQLAQDSEKVKRYLHSKHERDAIVDDSDLPASKKQALKDNNFRKVREIIHEENPDADVYLVPMGQQITSL
jgi:hypothetical protein